jgi:palmitoyltransferase
MDHHCPWTSNCVSHTTFPHFIRFVFYAVLSMSILAYHLFRRIVPIWNDRHLPAYLGPPTWAMAHLLLLCVVNGITLFALAILLVRSIYSLAINTTMIESWEIERHEALVKRLRKSGGYVYASGGQKMRVEHQEFPYDIGIWRNLCQGMGTSIVLLWFLPFGPAPGIESAAKFEVNDFEDESKVWPPPDPDKMPRAPRRLDQDLEVRHYGSPTEEKEAFKRRQQEDFERRRMTARREAVEDDSDNDEDELDEYENEYEEYEEGLDGEEGWTNSDGERLRDFGVDEDAELLADDDIPLGELLRRRKGKAMEDD